MRVVVSLAICVGTGVLSQARATDPTPVTPQSQTVVQSTAAATPSVPAAKSNSVPFTRDEQLLLVRGFHVVEDKTDQGERIFCRTEAFVGSRITSEQVCGTAKQINDIAGQTQGAMAGQTQSAIRRGDVAAFQNWAHAPGRTRAKNGTDSDLCSRGKPEAAINSCTRIINDSRVMTELRAMALRNRGWLFQSNGDLDRAIEDFTAVLQLSPGQTKVNAMTSMSGLQRTLKRRSDWIQRWPRRIGILH